MAAAMMNAGVQPRILRFARYLIAQGICRAEVAAQALRLHRDLDTRMGHLAVLKRFMTPTAVLEVLSSQTQHPGRFGELAARSGLLRDEQVHALLHVQADSLGLFGDCLSAVKAANSGTLDEARRAFERSAECETVHPETRSGDRVRAVLRKVTALATFPALMHRILGMLEDPACRLDQVAKRIEADQALSAQVLRLVNSASFSLRSEIQSIPRAVLLLGIRGMQRMMLSCVALDQFRRVVEERGRPLWEHSTRTAVWARLLAMDEGKGASDEAFLAGILHDFGKAVLYQYMPDEMIEVEGRVRGGAEPLGAEREVLGLTHAEAGAFLARLWSFPASLRDGVFHHHATIPLLRNLEVSPVARLVNAACRIARAVGENGSGEGMEDEFLTYHGIARNRLAELWPEVRQETREVALRLF